MKTPLVSCLCPTYGRPESLGEAVKCFLDQDYENKELIILNDQTNVNLIIDGEPDNIHVYNNYERFKSLGEKRNRLTSLANGEYFCIWDDDDLYTPWRISDSVKSIQVFGFNVDILKANQAFMSVNNQDYQVARNLFHSQAIVTKDYMTQKKYPDKSVGEDADFEDGARIMSVAAFPLLWYVYRWGGKDIHHLSGIADEKASWEKSLTYTPYCKLNGEIVIRPRFKMDYWSDISKLLSDHGKKVKKVWDEKISKISLH